MMEDTQIMDIWDLFAEHIPEKHRDSVAAQYIEYLLNHDVEIEVLESLIGNDDHLDEAIEEAIEGSSYYDEELDDDDGNY